MLQPHRALETVVTQWKNVEQRLHSDTAGPYGIQETIVMEWKLMESCAQGFMVRPHGNQVTIVVQRNLKETRVNWQPITDKYWALQKTLQKEGLVKSWLRPLTSAK